MFGLFLALVTLGIVLCAAVHIVYGIKDIYEASGDLFRGFVSLATSGVLIATIIGLITNLSGK